jgi:hypothetical protein
MHGSSLEGSYNWSGKNGKLRKKGGRDQAFKVFCSSAKGSDVRLQLLRMNPWTTVLNPTTPPES